MYRNTLVTEYKKQKLRQTIAHLYSELDDRTLMKAQPCLQANLTREITRLGRELDNIVLRKRI